MNRDMVSSLIWIGVGGIFCAGAVSYKLFRAGIPGSGFFPFLGGAILIALSLILFVSSLRRASGKREEEKFFPQRSSSRRISLALSSLLAYWAALEFLGFVPTTFIFILFLLRSIEPQRWTLSITTSALTTILSYLLFVVWLRVRLPQGILGI